MWNEFSTSPIFDLQICNAPQKISKSILITYLKEKMPIYVRKKVVLTIFVKKSFFFRAKKKIDGNFFVEITKKSEK